MISLRKFIEETGNGLDLAGLKNTKHPFIMIRIVTSIAVTWTWSFEVIEP